MLYRAIMSPKLSSLFLLKMTNEQNVEYQYSEYKVDFHANEKHTDDEWDPTTEGKIADWHERHKDKVLDEFCDMHPGSPECKVFDD